MKAILNSAGPAFPALLLSVTSDERLARSASHGRSEAVDQIFDRHYDELHAYAHVVLGSGAEADAALDAARRSAQLALGEDRREIAVRPWLYRLVHNESAALLRRRQMGEAQSPFEVRPATPEPPASADPDLDGELHQLALDMRGLGEAERGAILMRELGDFDYDEIADAFACTVPAARRLVFRARGALHEAEHGRSVECVSGLRPLFEGNDRLMSGMRIRVHLLRCRLCRDLRQATRARSELLGQLVLSGRKRESGSVAADARAGVGRV